MGGIFKAFRTCIEDCNVDNLYNKTVYEIFNSQEAQNNISGLAKRYMCKLIKWINHILSVIQHIRMGLGVLCKLIVEFFIWCTMVLQLFIDSFKMTPHLSKFFKYLNHTIERGSNILKWFYFFIIFIMLSSHLYLRKSTAAKSPPHTPSPLSTVVWFCISFVLTCVSWQRPHVFWDVGKVTLT